jgi:hypothetical protein
MAAWGIVTIGHGRRRSQLIDHAVRMSTVDGEKTPATIQRTGTAWLASPYLPVGCPPVWGQRCVISPPSLPRIRSFPTPESIPSLPEIPSIPTPVSRKTRLRARSAGCVNILNGYSMFFNGWGKEQREEKPRGAGSPTGAPRGSGQGWYPNEPWSGMPPGPPRRNPFHPYTLGRDRSRRV